MKPAGPQAFKENESGGGDGRQCKTIDDYHMSLSTVLSILTNCGRLLTSHPLKKSKCDSSQLWPPPEPACIAKGGL